MLRELKFKEFVILQRGFDLPLKDRVEGPYPVVAATSIHGYHAEYKVKPPGVTTGRSGALGEVVFVNTPFWPLNTTLWIKDFKGNVPRYVYYFLKTLNLKRYNSGAGVPTLNRNHLNNIEVAVHTNKDQRKIAAILGAYDDLIENNLRRIKILEEMARLIYREWFVHFRFPGHEDIPLVDSPLGKIPEGWEVKQVRDSFDVVGGGTPSKKKNEYWENGDIVWYVPSDLTSAKTMFIEESGSCINNFGLKKSSAKLFPAYSVMLTSRATVGVVSINTTPAATNQGFITCIPNERIALFYLYFWLKENTETFIRLATGATFKEITKSVFKTIDQVVPDMRIVTRFEKSIEPLRTLILNLQRQNKGLLETRDLLLPKLISGEIDVSGLDVDVGEEEA